MPYKKQALILTASTTKHQLLDACPWPHMPAGYQEGLLDCRYALECVVHSISAQKLSVVVFSQVGVAAL